MKKVFSILDEEPVLSNTGTTTPDMQNNNVIEFIKLTFLTGERFYMMFHSLLIR